MELAERGRRRRAAIATLRAEVAEHEKAIEALREAIAALEALDTPTADGQLR